MGWSNCAECFRAVVKMLGNTRCRLLYSGVRRQRLLWPSTTLNQGWNVFGVISAVSIGEVQGAGIRKFGVALFACKSVINGANSVCAGIPFSAGVVIDVAYGLYIGRVIVLALMRVFNIFKVVVFDKR